MIVSVGDLATNGNLVISWLNTFFSDDNVIESLGPKLVVIIGSKTKTDDQKQLINSITSKVENLNMGHILDYPSFETPRRCQFRMSRRFNNLHDFNGLKTNDFWLLITNFFG